MSALEDFPIGRTIEAVGMTPLELIDSIKERYGFDYRFQEDKIIFAPVKAIEKEAETAAFFDEVSEIESIESSTELFKRRIKRIVVNKRMAEEGVTVSTSLKMKIEPSPQPCGPPEVLAYQDGDTTYKIGPRRARFVIYYWPTTMQPRCNFTVKSGVKRIVESHSLNNERFLLLSGNINDPLSVKIDGTDTPFGARGRLIEFFDPVSADVKVSYKSEVLFGVIENSPLPKEIAMTITHYDRRIDYTHKIELNGYYPIPYDLTLNAVAAWGVSDDVCSNRIVDLYRFDQGIGDFVSVGSVRSDGFCDLTVPIDRYGTYKLIMGGREPLFLDWFVNRMETYLNEKACR